MVYTNTINPNITDRTAALQAGKLRRLENTLAALFERIDECEKAGIRLSGEGADGAFMSDAKFHLRRLNREARDLREVLKGRARAVLD